MRITKFTHSCVRLDDGERRLLLDPGIWTGPEAYEDVDHVLITHEHIDHVDVEAITALARRRSGLVVHAPAPVVDLLAGIGSSVVTVAPGDRLTVNGFEVAVVGGRHADIYDGLPGCANVGYVIDGSVYHPGDSFSVPELDVATLLLPVSGPWHKLAEAIDFVRAVAPVRAVAVHDALLSPEGNGIVDRWITMKGETDYRRLAVGDSLED
jgi:L-ascorbate metabolism protein UlaG (beta-lactamase superfamily)